MDARGNNEKVAERIDIISEGSAVPRYDYLYLSMIILVAHVYSPDISIIDEYDHVTKNRLIYKALVKLISFNAKQLRSSSSLTDENIYMFLAFIFAECIHNVFVRVENIRTMYTNMETAELHDKDIVSRLALERALQDRNMLKLSIVDQEDNFITVVLRKAKAAFCEYCNANKPRPANIVESIKTLFRPTSVIEKELETELEHICNCWPSDSITTVHPFVASNYNKTEYLTRASKKLSMDGMEHETRGHLSNITISPAYLEKNTDCVFAYVHEHNLIEVYLILTNASTEGRCICVSTLSGGGKYSIHSFLSGVPSVTYAIRNGTLFRVVLTENNSKDDSITITPDMSNDTTRMRRFFSRWSRYKYKAAQTLVGIDEGIIGSALSIDKPRSMALGTAISGLALWVFDRSYKNLSWVSYEKTKRRDGSQLTLGQYDAAEFLDTRLEQQHVTLYAGKSSAIWSKCIMMICKDYDHYFQAV